MSSKVKIHIEKMLPDEKRFIEQFGLIRNHVQSKGTAFDAEDQQGFRYEYKNDKAAEKTGNIFLETHQTAGSDDAGNLIWDHSGFSLALLQAKYLVYRIGQNYFQLECDELDMWISANPRKCKEIQTRPGSNGNREGKFAKGLLIKVEDLHKVPKVRIVPCLK